MDAARRRSPFAVLLYTARDDTPDVFGREATQHLPLLAQVCVRGLRIWTSDNSAILDSQPCCFKLASWIKLAEFLAGNFTGSLAKFPARYTCLFV